MLLTRRAGGSGATGPDHVAAGRFTAPTPGSAFGVLRVNVVSPGWVTETLQAMGRAGGGPSAGVAARYVRAVEDRTITGATLT